MQLICDVSAARAQVQILWIHPSVRPPPFSAGVRDPVSSRLPASTQPTSVFDSFSARPPPISSPSKAGLNRRASQVGVQAPQPHQQQPPPDDGLEPDLQQFMAAPSPGIDMASDHTAAATAAAAAGSHGAASGALGGDAVLLAVQATRMPAEERDRLLLDRIQRAIAAELALMNRIGEKAYCDGLRSNRF